MPHHAAPQYVFLIGMPRSGTTVIFEALAARRDLGWFSNLLRRVPSRPAISVLSRGIDLSLGMRRSVSRSDQRKPWLERFRVGPDEAYPVWARCCGTKFEFDYLVGVEASPDEKACLRATVVDVLRYQGKPHFAAKLTGPGRIGYLSSIFPSARFVHVVRDGRAVVQSLMRIHFWRTHDRMYRPAWRGGLTERDLADWERYDRSPLALAAVQWRRVVESTRSEAAGKAPDRYAEVNYEAFVAEPHRALNEISRFYGLEPSLRAERFLRQRFELRDMNRLWQERFDRHEVVMLNELLGDVLEAFGYAIDPRERPGEHPVLTTPFASSQPTRSTKP